MTVEIDNEKQEGTYNTQDEGQSKKQQPTKAGKAARVVVVGAGFGGLHVIKALANQEAVEVLVLDRNNYHGFWPLLYQVATAALEPDSIAYPTREIVRKYKNVKFQMVTVNGIDLEHQQVLLEGNQSLAYDYLVLAAGSANNYFGNKVIPQHTYSLKDVGQAVEIQQQLLMVFEAAVRETNAERRKVLLTIAVVGAGPTGVELAGAFADLICPLLRKNYPTLSEKEVRIVLVEAHDTMLSAFPKPLQKKAQQHLEKMGIEVLPNSKVTNVEDKTVSFENGKSLQAATVVWAAGVKAAKLGQTLKVKLAHSDRVPVKPTLNLVDHAEVFVIGDMAYLDGYKQSKHDKPQAYPMLAEVAMQMGDRAAHNILATISHQPLESFRYRDLGTMCTIGRKDAVAYAFGVQLSGIIAWLAWLIVHVAFMVSFRNRLRVLLAWAYDYITYNRGVRLIGGQPQSKAAPANE